MSWNKEGLCSIKNSLNRMYCNNIRSLWKMLQILNNYKRSKRNGQNGFINTQSSHRTKVSSQYLRIEYQS